VIFLVVGDLLQEEKLVALAVDLCEHIRGNHICLILFMISFLELDLVFTSVEQSPRAFNHASASFVISTHVLDQFNLEVLGNADSIVFMSFRTVHFVHVCCHGGHVCCHSGLVHPQPLRTFRLCCCLCPCLLLLWVSAHRRIHVPVFLWVSSSVSMSPY
jgi:hypothetical protein